MSGVLTVIGSGLAGSEAAWQAAQRGVRVRLCEMRPHVPTPVHRTGFFAELVCSNSLRGAALDNAVGLLKEEMRRAGSLVMAMADAHAVPAGGALAVDRDGFAAAITDALTDHPLVEVIRGEVTDIPADGVVVVASGPLTSPALAASIARCTGEEYLAFFDAAAPIVTYESLDLERVFRASRYGKGEDEAYLNCPMTEAEYDAFWQALVTAEKAVSHHPEEASTPFFEGCLPVEEMARRGRDTLLFGPLKPMGLIDPATGRRPFAVVQLRQDNAAGSHYNLVGFQTSLKWGEQKRAFGMIPGLAAAEFVRFGVIHRNIFIKSPRVLLPTLQLRQRPELFFAGQITGVEGYVESAAGGLVAGINAACVMRGLPPLAFPPETALGALARYITTAKPDHFQPMNIAFGLLPPLAVMIRDRRARKLAMSQRALQVLADFLSNHI